ncbi:MAG: class I SAM-dependent methyltransferase, partial [bacterium]
GLPESFLLNQLHRFYLSRCIPMIGWMVHRSGEMYRYLASSAFSFLSPKELSAQCAAAGLEAQRVERFLFGSSVGVLAVKSE